MEASAFIFPFLTIKYNTSFICFLIRTTIDHCGYTLSMSLSTTMILNLLLIYFPAWEFERPFCLRLLHEISNLCAIFGQYILLLLLFVLLPLQSHFTPPLKTKKSQTISDEGLTLETSAFQIFHGGNSIVGVAIGIATWIHMILLH